MSKRLLILSLLFIYFVRPSQAQKIDSVLNIYAERFTPEKLHLHFDRSFYSKEETIFFKAYLLQDHDLSTLSKTLYVDFYDDAGKLLLQTTAPLFQSCARGSFSIPPDYPGRLIHVRAYTKWMLNFDTAFVYKRAITVFQPGSAAADKINTAANAVTTVSFYPEGGFLVEGLQNRVAFAATNRNGNPVGIKGLIRTLKNGNNDTIRSIHDGMGSFNLIPEAGKEYFLEWWDEHGQKGTTPVPAGKKSGISMRIDPSASGAAFSVRRSADADQQLQSMHLLVHRNQSLRYKIDINLKEKTFIGFNVPTADLYTGIVQFTLFDASWIPVAERIIFVNNHNHFFEPEVKVISQNLTAKGKNEIQISVRDSLLANMSVSVVGSSLLDSTGEPSIFSDFLLTDELKGKINDPAYYFSGDTPPQAMIPDSVKASQLDLVMLTHGHRRYDWEKIATGKLPSIRYPAETDYIGIRGKVVKEKYLQSRNPLTVNIMLQGRDSVKSVYAIPVEKDGTFRKSNAFYYDTVTLYYSLSGRRIVLGDKVVEFDNNFLASDLRNKFFAKQMIMAARSALDDQGDITSMEQAGIRNFFAAQQKIRDQNKYDTLKEVIVNSKIRTKTQVLDDYYTSGFFAGDGNNFKVDLEGDVTARGYRNIFDYLVSKIPGLNVYQNGTDIVVTWIRNFELIGSETGPSYFLNEIPTTLDAILGVPISDIVYVKAFKPPFVGSFLNGASGSIAVYTKKGNRPVNDGKEATASEILEGYTRFKEFLQPVYEGLKPGNANDSRSTLYWNPYIFTDNTTHEATISFYNNDISSKLYFILEGINLEGKMARVVKVLE